MNQEIKPEVEQLIAKGYSTSQISQILNESKSEMDRLLYEYFREIEKEQEGITLTTEQVVEIRKIINEVLEDFNISRTTKENIRERIIIKLEA